MAKRSKVVKNEQRMAKTARLKERRDELRATSKDISKSLEERMEARALLGRLSRDSAPCRIRRRCKLTGRPRGYVGRFGISRNRLREMAHEGVLPGLTKSSW